MALYKFCIVLYCIVIVLCDEEVQKCAVELIPGSGVFVSGLFYAGCCQQPSTNGSQLVRKLVREVFTDDEILSGATCTGKVQRWPRSKELLHLNDRKVNAIKGMVHLVIWLIMLPAMWGHKAMLQSVHKGLVKAFIKYTVR